MSSLPGAELKETVVSPDAEVNVEPIFQSPFDFPTWRKWLITVFLALVTTVVTFSSSIWSATISKTSVEFGVSETVALLGVSLYVLGFAMGPLFWGPLSELKGRRLPLFAGFFLFGLAQIPVALCHNLPGIFICRYLAGCFGASPLTLVSACYADYWEPSQRGTAQACYAAAIYIGPTLGPIAGAYLTESHLGWRWTAWVTLIAWAVVLPPAYLIIPETYAPLLRERALQQWYKTNPHAMAQQPNRQNEFSTFIRKYLVKPAIMVSCEPMLDVMTLYICIVYGILYLTFFAFPYSFSVERGWKPTTASLPFISILIGTCFASAMVAIFSQKYYLPRLQKRGKVLPEDRLPPIMVGSVLLPAGFFFYAWTSSPHITWVPQVISGAIIGSGIMLIFTNGIAFLVDIYLSSAASALAVNTCLRSMMGAGFPLAAPSMYRSLGTPWATSVLGFLCILIMPAPFLFWRYGANLRQMSRYAPA